MMRTSPLGRHCNGKAAMNRIVLTLSTALALGLVACSDKSPEEAQRFWPIYNKYTEEIKAIRQAQKQNNGTTDTELAMEEKILAVRKKYNGEFSKALSAEKVNTFFRSEKDFGALIQRELQERRMNRQLNKRGLRD